MSDPDLSTRIARARAAYEAAQLDVDAAGERLDECHRELAELERLAASTPDSAPPSNRGEES